MGVQETSPCPHADEKWGMQVYSLFTFETTFTFGNGTATECGGH